MKPSSSSSAPVPPPVEPGPVTVTSADVLSGRYNYSFNHEGNNFFRDAIQDNREEYQAASRRAIKNQITQAVIRLVQVERGGRFLKLNDRNQWVVMSDEMVYEKVSHALRGSKKKYGQSKQKEKEKLVAGASGAGASGAAARHAASGTAATTSIGSASSAASSSAAGASGGRGRAGADVTKVPHSSYQARGSPFVNRAYLDIMARQKVIFEGMVNGSMLRIGDEGDPSGDGDNNDNDDDHDDDDGEEDDNNSDAEMEDDNNDDGACRDDGSAAAHLSRRRDSGATELTTCGDASSSYSLEGAHLIADAATALVSAMRRREDG